MKAHLLALFLNKKAFTAVVFLAAAIFCFAGYPTTASAQTASDFCGNEPGMANYFGVPYPARASSAARSLITCIQFNIPNPSLIGTIYTYQENINLRMLNYTRGNRVCGITETTCLANGGCHAVNSCHYGGKTGTDGAEGVDYNAQDPARETELYQALQRLVYPGGACHGLAKYIGLEGNHTHLSTSANAGCDSPNIPGISGSSGGGTTTPRAPTGPPRATSILPNPITCSNVTCVLVSIIKIILGMLGIVGTFMFVYGGFLFLTSGGNPDTVRKAKSTILYSTLGIVFALASWIIVSTVYSVAVVGKT